MVSFVQGRVRPGYVVLLLAALCPLVAARNLLGVWGFVAACALLVVGGVAFLVVSGMQFAETRERAGHGVRILYLRPESTDYTLVDTGPVSWILRRGMPRDVSDSLEWVLASRNLQLIKLGYPSNKTYREKILVPAKEDWQARVQAEMDGCSMALVYPGTTSGITWEMRRLLSGDYTSKHPVVLLFPPDSRADAASRWNAWASEFDILPRLPEKPAFYPVLLYLHGGVRHWVVAAPTVLRSKAHIWTYFAGLQLLSKQHMGVTILD